MDTGNLQLTASQANQSLNTHLQSKCSKDTVQKLKYEKSDLSIQLSYNLLDIGMDLVATVIEFQKQKIELIQQKNVVRMSCELSGLCIKTFDLKALLKSKVATNVGFIINFIALGEDELMYIKEGEAKFIGRNSFRHFVASNIHIDLWNITTHVIFIQNNLERKLTNYLNGTCYCKKCKNLENLHHRQNGIKRTLQKIIFLFMELGSSLDETFPIALQECLQAFLKGNTCLMQEPSRSKRSIFGANNHNDLRKVRSVFERNFKNILEHEKIRGNELQSIKHRI